MSKPRDDRTNSTVVSRVQGRESLRLSGLETVKQAVPSCKATCRCMHPFIHPSIGSTRTSGSAYPMSQETAAGKILLDEGTSRSLAPGSSSSSSNSSPSSAAAAASTASTSTPQAATTAVSKEMFEFGSILGEGAFGQVRICRKRDTGALYAAKILRKEQLIKAKQTKYVKSEKTIMSQLSHPFVARLFYSFADAKKLYLIMELIKGGELFTLLREGCDDDAVAASMDTIRFYMAELLVALEYVHSKGIVHRDLKPENLLLDEDGHLKLVDFGIAKSVGSAIGIHTFCGTAEYVAPEVIKSSCYGLAIDWWAFGCIIYEAIVGTSPFFASSVTLTYQKVMAREVYWPPDMPPEARDLIDKLLCLDMFARLGCKQASSASSSLSSSSSTATAAMQCVDAAENIKAHPFFRGIDFASLASMSPPIKPAVSKRAISTQQSFFSDPDNGPGVAGIGGGAAGGEAAGAGSGHTSKSMVQVERYRARSIIANSDPSQLNRARDILRRSAMLREMYPELQKIPPRPLPVQMDSAVSPSLTPLILVSERSASARAHDVTPAMARAAAPSGAGDSTGLISLVRRSANASLRHCKSIVPQRRVPVRQFAWSPSGGNRFAVAGSFSLATSCFDPLSTMDNVRVWPEWRVNAGSSAHYLSFSSDGRFLAADFQRQIGLVDFGSGGKIVPSLSPLSIPASSSSPSSSSSSSAASAASYSYNSSSSTSSLLLSSSSPPSFVGCGGPGASFLSSSSSSSSSGELVEYPVKRLVQHHLPVISVAFNNSSTLLASGSMDQTVVLWSLAKRKASQKLRGHDSFVASLSWMAGKDADMLVSGGGDARVLIFDASVGRVVQTLKYHKHAVSQVTCHPSLPIVASVAADRRLAVVDTRVWSFVSVLSFPSAPERVSFSPSGQHICTSGKDCIRIWHFPDMKLAATIQSDPMTTGLFSWSESGRYFASIDEDNAPVVYDLQTDEIVPVVSGGGSSQSQLLMSSGSSVLPYHQHNYSYNFQHQHGSPVSSLEWCPCADVLAVGCLDGSLSFWKIYHT